MTDNRARRTWLDRMIAEEPIARERWPVGAVFQPHDGVTSDANLFYADLLAGPDDSVPDIMEGYVPPAVDDPTPKPAGGEPGTARATDPTDAPSGPSSSA